MVDELRAARLDTASRVKFVGAKETITEARMLVDETLEDMNTSQEDPSSESFAAAVEDGVIEMG